MKLYQHGANMIVVSDLMGTLTTGSPVLGLVDWVRHNQSKMQARLYMLSIMPSYFIAKRGWIDWQTWAQGLMVNSLKMIKEATPEKMKIVSEWAVEHDLWKKRREDVIARLKEHASQGAQVYIASSVVEPIIEQVLRRLGVQRVDFAYGDTAQDVPLLEHANHPVAVYPDEALKAVALARGWEILGSREKDG